MKILRFSLSLHGNGAFQTLSIKLLIGTMALLFMSVFVGCNKDHPAELPHVVNESSNRALIQTFIEHAMCEGYVDDTTYSKEDAVWILEAAVNHKFADLSHKILEFQLDTTQIVIRFNDYGSVDQASLLIAFRNFVQAKEQNSLPDGRLIKMINLNATEHDKYLFISIVRFAGFPFKGKLNTTFGPSDNFLWWDVGGGSNSCACQYSPPNSSFPCADKQIERRIKMPCSGELVPMRNHLMT